MSGDRGLLAVLAAEAVLLAGYASQGATRHWLVHLLAGGAAGLLVLAALSASRRAVPRGALAVLGGHLVAAAPDALFAVGVAHRPWMDLLVLHLSADRAPGGLAGPYAAMVAAVAALLAVRSRAGRPA